MVSLQSSRGARRLVSALPFAFCYLSLVVFSVLSIGVRAWRQFVQQFILFDTPARRRESLIDDSFVDELARR